MTRRRKLKPKPDWFETLLQASAFWKHLHATRPPIQPPTYTAYQSTDQPYNITWQGTWTTTSSGAEEMP